jgi:hypothetical protein
MEKRFVQEKPLIAGKAVCRSFLPVDAEELPVDL